MSSPRSPNPSRRTPLREDFDDEWSPRHSPRISNRQEPPTLRSQKSSKRTKLIDPPKLLSITEAREKRKARADLVARRWDCLRRMTYREGLAFLIIVAVLFAIRQFIASNPFSPIKSPENFDIDPSFSALYNLTNVVASYSGSHCLELVLVRYKLVSPAKSFPIAACWLPEGNTTLTTSIKADALTYTAHVTNASFASETLFTSFMGLRHSAISSLNHALGALGEATVYNQSDIPIVPHDPVGYTKQLVLPRPKVRHVLTVYLDQLASSVDEARNHTLNLDNEFRVIKRQWKTLSKLIDRREKELEGVSETRRWRTNNPTILGYGARISALLGYFGEPSAKRLSEAIYLHTLFNPIEDILYPSIKERDPWEIPSIEIEHDTAQTVLKNLLVQLNQLRKDIAKVRRGLAGRTAFWRGFLQADRLVMRVNPYVESLEQLRRNLGVESKRGLLACRKGYAREMEASNKSRWDGGWFRSADEDFPDVDSW